MKNKKLLTMISSIAMAALLGISAFTGCSKEEHMYVWDEDSEVKATCTTEGRRHGVCADCGDYKEEILPIDPDNHDYGEWEITEYPDEDKTGEAVKTCGYNSAHQVKATLPKLTETFEGYLSNTVVTPATAIAAGSRELVLENAAGNVTLTVEIPKREVETVEDAVVLGSSLGHLVRSSSGYFAESSVTDNNVFTCYYGDGYTHIEDKGYEKDNGAHAQEYWIMRDGEDNVFGIMSREGGEPRAAENITEDYMLGYGYASGANDMRTFGAESTLLQYYERAKTAREQGTAVLYDENITTLQGGGFRAWFSYSYYENPRFVRYRLEFTLNGTGVITSLTLSTNIIHPFMIAEDGRGNKLFYENGDMIFAEIYELDSNQSNIYEYEADGSVKIDGVKTDSNGVELKDANGETIPRPKPGNRGNDTGRRYYSDDHTGIDRKTLVYEAPVLKTENDVVPDCPYSSDDLFITSFGVSYNNRPVGEEGVTVDANRTAVFEITDIQPTTASIEYDPIRVYLRTPTRDIQLTNNHNDNSYNTMGFFNIDTVGTGANRRNVGRVTVNARYAGELTIVLKTKGGRSEKEIKLNLAKGAPTAMSAEVYVYSDSDGRERHVWTEYNNASPAIVMYVGETLRMRAMAPDNEAQFVDASFNALIDPTGADTRITFTDDVDFNGITVSEAVPNVAGNYSIYLTFNRNENLFTYFSVEVREAPDMRPAIRGDGNGAEYTAHSNYIKLTNDNTNPAPADINVKFTPSRSNWTTGTITVDINGNTAEYSYRYTEATGTLETEYRSGISGTTLDFTFGRNEMYKITVRHSIGFGTNTETLVLKPVESAESA